MSEYIIDKEMCTGCTACLSACPVKCIEMVKDHEGFLYPLASSNCINCNKCRMICPVYSPKKSVQPFKQVAYAGLSKKYQVWQRSASGGAFSEICEAWDDNTTMFVGAAWDHLKVRHMCLEGLDQIPALCKSKYVSSEMGNSFTVIKTALESGKRVLFSGTPCQVAGLKAVLNNDYENLLLIDFICHGVGSPSVFQTCIDLLSKQFGGEIQKFEFRAKQGFYMLDHLQKIKMKSRDVFLINDPYIQLFLSQKCLRKSCSNCPFRNQIREGDITIADFKGLTKVFPQLVGEKQNYSTIIVNTQKGFSLLPVLKKHMTLYECDLEDIKKYNPLFYRQTKMAEGRDGFFSQYHEDNIKAVKDNTVPFSIYRKSIKRKIWDVLPIAIRKIVISTWGGVNNLESNYSTCDISKVFVICGLFGGESICQEKV